MAITRDRGAPATSAVDAPLVFMVGSPRTGSTVLRTVLNRSPHVCIASETHYMSMARRLRFAPRLQRMNDGDATELDRLVQDMLAEPFWIFVRRNASADDLRDRILRGEHSERGLFTMLLDLYVESKCGWSDGLVVGEKSPEHLRDVSRLLNWFPAARVIHTVRDPRAVYASSVRRARQGRWGVKTRARRLPGWLLDRLVSPVELLKTGIVWHDAARRDSSFERFLGDRYLRVRYEDFVSDPDRQLRRVCAFIDVPFSAELLDDVRLVGSSFSTERHGPQGIHRDGVERWQSEVPLLARRWLELTNGRHMRRLGYPGRSQRNH